jgi:effector-binding domain-containing protein
MLGEFRVERREAQPYLAIRSSVPMSALPEVIPRDIGAVLHTGAYDRLVDSHAALQAWAAEQGHELARGPAGFEIQLESYLTDPEEEPDFEKHETEVAYLLAR